MEEAGKVGIARFVMRTKQYLAAIRPKDGTLVLSTMVYADEVERPPTRSPSSTTSSDVEVSDTRAGDGPAAHRVARRPSSSPSKFHDTYREQVLDLIERKAAGERGRRGTGAAVEPDKVVDLMAALEASVAAAKDARKRHPTGRRRRRRCRATARPRGQEGRARARRSGPRRASARSAEAGR